MLCEALRSKQCPGAAAPVTIIDGRIAMYLCAEHARLLHADLGEVERACRRMICDARWPGVLAKREAAQRERAAEYERRAMRPPVERNVALWWPMRGPRAKDARRRWHSDSQLRRRERRCAYANELARTATGYDDIRKNYAAAAARTWHGEHRPSKVRWFQRCRDWRSRMTEVIELEAWALRHEMRRMRSEVFDVLLADGVLVGINARERSHSAARADALAAELVSEAMARSGRARACMLSGAEWLRCRGLAVIPTG
jgi:hypothetical protein